MHKTGPNRWQNPGPAHAAAGININKYKYKSAYFLRGVVGVGSVVTGSGEHVAMVCSDWFWCARDYGGYG